MKLIRIRLLAMLSLLFIHVLINPKEVLRYLKEAMLIREYRGRKYSDFKILKRARVMSAKLRGEEYVEGAENESS